MSKHEVCQPRLNIFLGWFLDRLDRVRRSLDVCGFHSRSIPDYPASSIEHPASTSLKRLSCVYTSSIWY